MSTTVMTDFLFHLGAGSWFGLPVAMVLLVAGYVMPKDHPLRSALMNLGGAIALASVFVFVGTGLVFALMALLGAPEAPWLLRLTFLLLTPFALPLLCMGLRADGISAPRRSSKMRKSVIGN